MLLGALTWGEQVAKVGFVSPPSSSDVVELRCASAFSFLEGASNPEDLAERAAELGYGAVALADRGGLYGIPRFHQAAKAAGIEAIVGARVAVKDGPELLLLVESQRGYRNLSRLLTVAHEHGGKRRRMGDLEPNRRGTPAISSLWCAETARSPPRRSIGAVACSDPIGCGSTSRAISTGAPKAKRAGRRPSRSHSASRSSRPTTCATRANRIARSSTPSPACATT